jgi:co-chaperonin GroES (HSP10)
VLKLDPELTPIPRGNPMKFKPGDRVLFGKWSGTEVKIDGEELLIMKESDVMASRKVA